MTPLETDVVVVGAGPGGMAAAVTAAEAGRRVTLIDDGTRAGGQIWRHARAVEAPSAARPWIERITHRRIEHVSGASVVDAIARGESDIAVRVERDGTATEFHSSTVIIATGARERFLPFPGWTTPGVAGVGGLQALMKNGLDVAGKRVLIAGSGPLLFPVAASLKSHGARLALVAEQAPSANVLRFAAGLWREPATAVAAARYRTALGTTPFWMGTWITGVDGDAAVRAATVTDGTKTWTIPCDFVAAAFGLVPNVELGRVIGCEIGAAGAIAVDDRQRTSIAGVYAVGECTGVAGVDAAVIEGQIAAMAIAGGGVPPGLTKKRVRLCARAQVMDAAFALRAELQTLAAPDTIVCRCEDVRMADIRQGWTSRQMKLYSRAGMGPCQGRVCGPALTFCFGAAPDSVRPPIFPARVSTVGADWTPNARKHSDPKDESH